MIFLSNASCNYSTRIFELEKGKEKGEEEPVLVCSFIGSLCGRRQLLARSRMERGRANSINVAVEPFSTIGLLS